MNKKRKQGLLGLTSQDEKVLRCLSNQKLSASALSLETRIPATTLSYQLKQLQKRGWIKKVYVGNKTLWTREQPDIHTEQLEESLKRLFQDFDRTSSATNQDPGIRYATGVESLLGVYETVSDPHKNHARTCLAITSTVCGDLALVKVHQWGKDHTLHTSNIEGTHSIITHTVLTDEYYTRLGEKQGKRWLSSFLGRASDTRIIPEGSLTLPVEILLFNNTIHLLDWREEKMLAIHTPGMVGMFEMMFAAMQITSKKIDQNAHIRSLLKME
jgi:hypothetical protein